MSVFYNDIEGTKDTKMAGPNMESSFKASLNTIECYFLCLYKKLTNFSCV
jgi:hypothetical protein